MSNVLDFSKNAKEMTNDLCGGNGNYNNSLAYKIIYETYDLFKSSGICSGIEFDEFARTAFYGIEILEKAPFDTDIEPLVTIEEYIAELKNIKKRLKNLQNHGIINPKIENIIKKVEMLIERASQIETECFWDYYCGVLEQVLHSIDKFPLKIEAKLLKGILAILGDIKDVRGKLDSGKQVRLLGKFIPDKMKIELYRDTISNEFTTDSECTDFLACVLCHELFHMYHFLDVRKNRGTWTVRRKSLRYRQYKCVKESLARFFEYEFAYNYNISSAVRDKINEMAQPLVPLFPYDAYSGSKYLIKSIQYPVTETCIKILYRFSLLNMDTPYLMLHTLSRMYYS